MRFGFSTSVFVLNRCIQISPIKSQFRFSLRPQSWEKAQCRSACILRCATSEAGDKVPSAPDLVACSRPGGASVGGEIPSAFLGLLRIQPSRLRGTEPLEYDNLVSSDDSVSKNHSGSGIQENVQSRAIELLATRAFSAQALRKKLLCKKFPIKAIDSVIVALQDRGLLNDGLYAESFSRSRWLSFGWGPWKIKRALLEKGISKEDANTAVSHVFQDEGLLEDGHNTHFGISMLNLDRLFERATKQWLRNKDKTLENRRSNMIRWLQCRGFDWGVTNFILKKLESEHPA